jgi:ApbE superfamily uncharacterized protein (UPF0280 family)
MGKERFCSFSVSYFETDLWIGVDPAHAKQIADMSKFSQSEIQNLRNTLNQYIAYNPDFFKSLIPIIVSENAPSLTLQMVNASRIANVGPMAAVAGTFAQHIGQQLKKEFELNEIAVENGGDIYLNLQNELVMSIFAGQSPLSEKVGIRVPAAFGEVGVCTSSGTVGPSLSFGKADAVVIACRDTALADAYATGIANKIQTPDDVEPVLEKLKNEKEILSAVIIYQDKMGIRGVFELEVL